MWAHQRVLDSPKAYQTPKKLVYFLLLRLLLARLAADHLIVQLFILLVSPVVLKRILELPTLHFLYFIFRHRRDILLDVLQTLVKVHLHLAWVFAKISYFPQINYTPKPL